MSGARLVVALYDNRAEYPDELSFKKGDLLELVDDISNPDWWVCVWMGRTGIAPANRLKLVVPQVPQKASRDSPNSSNSNPALRLLSSPNALGQGNYEEIADYDIPKSLIESIPPKHTTQPGDGAQDSIYANIPSTNQQFDQLRAQNATAASSDYENTPLYQNVDAVVSSSDYCNLPPTRLADTVRVGNTSPSHSAARSNLSRSNSKDNELDEANADYAKVPNSKPLNDHQSPSSPSTAASVNPNRRNECDYLPLRTGASANSPTKLDIDLTSADGHDYQVPPSAVSRSLTSLNVLSLNANENSRQQNMRTVSESEQRLNQIAYSHALAIDMDTALQRATALCEREFQANATRLFTFVRAGWKSPANLTRIANDIRTVILTLVRIINELERFADGVCANAHIVDERRLSKELDRAASQLRTAALDSAAHRESLDRLATEASFSSSSNADTSPRHLGMWRIDALFANPSRATEFEHHLDAFVNSVRDAAIIVRTLYALVRGNLRVLFASGIAEKLRELGHAREPEVASTSPSPLNRLAHARTRSEASRLLDAENYEVVVPDCEVNAKTTTERKREPERESERNHLKPMRSDSRLTRSTSTDALDSRMDDRTRVRRVGANDSSRTRSTPQSSTPDLGNALAESAILLDRMHDELHDRMEQLMAATQQESPIALVECTKQVVLVAYNLIYSGDTFRQQIDATPQPGAATCRGERLSSILSALCAQLKTLLISAKQAALDFPNADRLHALLDEAGSVTRSANELQREATQLLACYNGDAESNRS